MRDVWAAGLHEAHVSRMPRLQGLWKVTRKALRAVGVHVRSQEVPGELVYGGPAYATAAPAAAVRGAALHAWRVTLPHPVTREPLQLEAPVPRDLRGLMNR